MTNPNTCKYFRKNNPKKSQCILDSSVGYCTYPDCNINCQHEEVGQRTSNIWFNMNGEREWLARCLKCGKTITVRDEQ